MNPPIPSNETERLAALYRYAILDTPPEVAFDRITRLAARIFEVPIALITLVDRDRLWFKSCFGLELASADREGSFCAYTITRDGVMAVQDAARDARFIHNPLVAGAPHIRFYAGAPLKTPDGFNLGTLCLIDTIPRELTAAQRDTLADLAVVAVDELELRLAARENSRLAAAIDSAPVGVTISDPNQPDNPLIFANPAFGVITGYPPAEVTGHNCRFLRGPDTDPAAVEEVRQAIAGRQACTVVLLNYRRDGTPFWNELTISPVFDEAGELINFVGLQVDVTQRKQAELAVQQSEARLRAIVETAVDGIVTIDEQGLVETFNPAAARIFGYTPAEMIGGSLNRLMPEPDRSQHDGYVTRYLQTGEAHIIGIGREVTGQRKDGRLFPIYLAVSEVCLGARHLFTGIIRDITGLKQAELLEKDRNQVLEMVVQNQPLAIVLTEIARLVERQRPDMLTSVLLLRNGRVYHLAAPALPGDFVRLADGLPLGQVMGTPEATAYGGEVVIIPDLADGLVQDDYRELALTYGLQACWSLPLFSGDGALLGTMTMYYRQAGSPTAADRQLVEMAGRLAVIAVEHRQLTDQLAYQAQHDTLTGLPNRLLFQSRLQAAIAQARLTNSLVALLYVDLDRFKLINDTLGHAMGDRLLQQVARRLQLCARPADTVARMGGDEFILVLAELSQSQEATRVAETLLKTMDEPFIIGEQELFLTGSIGISFYPTDGDTVEELLRKADQALYRSKAQGKHTYRLYTTEMSETDQEQLLLAKQLGGALSRSELLLYYQPQFEVAGSRLVGVEALLRWNHPDLGLLAPGRFIPLAEESGLINPIGAWALAEACRQNQAWQRAGYPPLRIAVNVSALQFTRPDFIDVVLQALEQSGLAPAWLQLEVTESLLVFDPEEAAAKLARLKALGVSLAIDDFGTGFSSLSYLYQLPVDTLKIAHTFVREIGANIQGTPNGAAIIEATISLAHSLGMRVVAEGVESPEQLEFLRGVGCDEMQGHLFSRALPAAEFERMLKNDG